MADEKSNPMKKVRIQKLTLNMGAGTDQSKMDKAVKLLKMITGIEPMKTISNKRIPTWGVRPGLPLGCKITLRGEKANEVLGRLIKARDDLLPENAFDDSGNISFGIKEYIDIPGTTYDQSIGIIGLQATVTLERPGYRVKRRNVRPAKIGQHHRVSREDAMNFAKDELKIKIE